MTVSTLTYAAVAGIISHLAFFIRGEHHLHVTNLLALYLVAICGVFMCYLTVDESRLDHAIVSTVLLFGTYCIGLFGSITTYRLFFHDLRGFPGPTLAKVTKLWHTWQVLDAKQYLLLDRLHMQYGDFVRTGRYIDNVDAIDTYPKRQGLMRLPFFDQRG